MGQVRVDDAIGRIERALERVEAAGRVAAPPKCEDPEAAALRQAHLALRDKVETAIARIDELIAGETD